MPRSIFRAFFDHAPSDAVREALDLCFACKGCKSECPSNVDMARLKAEWEQQRMDVLGVPWRTRLVAGAEEEAIAPDSTGGVELDAFIPRLTVPASPFSPSTNQA